MSDKHCGAEYHEDSTGVHVHSCCLDVQHNYIFSDEEPNLHRCRCGRKWR